MRRGLLCVVALALLAGCGREPDVSAPDDISAFDKRAAQVADAWQASGIGKAWTEGFVPVQDLTIAPKEGFPNGDLKNAFAAGWYTTKLKLPDQAATGTIKYPDGSTSDVPLVSAAAAYQVIDQGDASCPGCQSLVITDAKLDKAQIRTSRGVAEVPVWAFTAEGISQPIMRVAVAPEAVKPVPTPSIPAWEGTDPLVSAQDLVAVQDSMIEYRLGVGACDKDIVGLVWESPSGDVVVIGGTVTPPGPEQACTAQLVLHPVQVNLRSPVGNRVILDAVAGNPVLLR